MVDIFGREPPSATDNDFFLWNRSSLCRPDSEHLQCVGVLGFKVNNRPVVCGVPFCALRCNCGIDSRLYRR